MLIGCSGTRDGMTREQLLAVGRHVGRLLPLEPPVLHHGGCVGADRQFHDIFRAEYGNGVRIVIHPAGDQPADLCDWGDADELLPARPSLERNRDIVAAILGGTLYACPKGMAEEWRSGT